MGEECERKQRAILLLFFPFQENSQKLNLALDQIDLVFNPGQHYHNTLPTDNSLHTNTTLETDVHIEQAFFSDSLRINLSEVLKAVSS